MTESYKLGKIIERMKLGSFFNDIRFMRTHNSALPRMCRDADGNLIVHQPQEVERWKEYFMKMFIVAEIDHISDIMDDLYIEQPMYNEVCTIINRLRINKAARPDNITPELIKLGV
jgi:hypothetical protein